MEHKNKKDRSLMHKLSLPIIYSMIIPLLIMDIWVEFYHQICFRLYGIPRINRSDYIKIKDRTELNYLSGVDKIHCAYCGYANGLAHYLTAIGGNTEAYWCGIKHQKTKGFKEQEHQKNFLKYGDEKSFNKKYKN